MFLTTLPGSFGRVSKMVNKTDKTGFPATDIDVIAAEPV
jgi:hypothetical protein